MVCMYLSGMRIERECYLAVVHDLMSFSKRFDSCWCWLEYELLSHRSTSLGFILNVHMILPIEHWSKLHALNLLCMILIFEQ